MGKYKLIRHREPLVLMLALSMLVSAALVSPILTRTAIAQEEIADYSRFYDELEQYGRWFEHPRWGFVWSPRVDEAGWRPYTRGHWVRTEEHGWYWESEEPWGWATYHYGRWVLDDAERWLWIPGREWAPAWVAWRNNDEYIGWAPLPPEAVWEEERGELNFSPSYYDAPRFAPVWCFVAPAYLMTPGLHRYIVPRSRAPFIYRQTRFINGYGVVNRGVFNRGVDVRLVERAINRPIRTVSILRANSPREHGARRSGAGLGAISVYRPNFVAPRGEGGRPAPRNFVPINARTEGVRPENFQPGIMNRSLARTPAAQPPGRVPRQREVSPEFDRPTTAGRAINVEPRREPWQPPQSRGERPNPLPQITRQPPPPQRVERQPPPAPRSPEGFRQPPPQMMRQASPPPPPQVLRPAPPSPPQVMRQAPPPQVMRQAPSPQAMRQPLPPPPRAPQGQPQQRKPPVPGQEGQPPK